MGFLGFRLAKTLAISSLGGSAFVCSSCQSMSFCFFFLPISSSHRVFDRPGGKSAHLGRGRLAKQVADGPESAGEDGPADGYPESVDYQAFDGLEDLFHFLVA